MKIITKKVGKPAKIIELDKLDLRIMQNLVGGLIQPVYMGNVICWVNEEGKLYGLDVNVAVTASGSGEFLDTLHGDIFFTNEEDGDEGLSDAQINMLLAKLNRGTCTFAGSDMHEVPIFQV